MDILDDLASAAQERVKDGFYRGINPEEDYSSKRSMAAAIRSSEGNPIVAEIKLTSPSSTTRSELNVGNLIGRYEAGGAVGLSVLTDPDYFGGSLEYLRTAAQSPLPVLMKDFILHPDQFKACARVGGDCVLLIMSLFERNYPEFPLETAIEIAHSYGLETLLEVSSREEYLEAASSATDMIGVNNRDLSTLEVDISRTARIVDDGKRDNLLWALSGIDDSSDLTQLKGCGVNAFLVGTSLVRARSPQEKLQELVHA